MIIIISEDFRERRKEKEGDQLPTITGEGQNVDQLPILDRAMFSQIWECLNSHLKIELPRKLLLLFWGGGKGN